MPHQLALNSAVTTWTTGSDAWNSEFFTTENNKNYSDLSTQQQHVSSLLSNLSLLFLNTINYRSLTKHEALDAVGYFLYEYDDLMHLELVECFMNHQLLIYSSNSTDRQYFTINFHQQSKINGIFTPLASCYAPSCQHNNITCYSPLCPNKRISSFLRIANQDFYHLYRQQQTNDYTNQDITTEQKPKDWIQSIPNYIRDCTSRKELKRQAGIAELVTTEQNYRQDLDILHRIYAIPLLESPEVINNPSRRQRFYNNVFGNYLDITHLHQSFHNQLTCYNRQSSFFIGRVGTIIMQHIANLIEPYIQYASNHVKAIYCMTIEHKNNPQFATFLTSQNAFKCTRRLGLRHFLSAPTLWLGKLKLMIEAILKNTVDDADQLSLKACLIVLHDTLCRMNSCVKMSPDDLRFEELSTSIYTLSGISSELDLLPIPDNSVLVQEEALWLARSSHPLQPSLCHVFLFSHALILTHPRVINGRTEYIVVSGSPIPIQFLSVGNSNASTSMIRRLSFASTSMVSTPLHLINNLRRQKSMTSETSTNSSVSHGSNISSTASNCTNDVGLCRKNTTINVILPTRSSSNIKKKLTRTVQDSPTSSLSSFSSSSVGRKSHVLLPFQIRTRFSKLRKSLRTNFSLPNSPIAKVGTTSISRRDSAPALMLSSSSSNHHHQQQSSAQQQGDQQQEQESIKLQQRRTTNIFHIAYPDNAFKLEFLTRSDRLQWESLVRDVKMESDRSSQVFKLKMVCKSLIMPSSTSVSSSSSPTTYTTFTATTATASSGERVKCAFTFAFNGKTMIALGTQHGIWIGSRDKSIPFQLVLSNQDVHQLNVLQDALLVLNHDSKQNSSSLIAYRLKSVIIEEEGQQQQQAALDWCAVKRSLVICFTVGTLKSQGVIAYLTKRLQTVWLVIVVPSIHANDRSNWYKKLKMEYKVTIRDPTDIQILGGSVFVRSDRYGVERVDITSSMESKNSHVYSGPNVGLLLSYGTDHHQGLICDLQFAYALSLFQNSESQVVIRDKFESQINNIAIVYPYLIAFSSSVIEIRNIETTELTQVIRGNHIEFISTTNRHRQPLLFTMMNDESKTTVSSIYLLELSPL